MVAYMKKVNLTIKNLVHPMLIDSMEYPKLEKNEDEHPPVKMPEATE
jgi:hypothetical protein